MSKPRPRALLAAVVLGLLSSVASAAEEALALATELAAAERAGDDARVVELGTRLIEIAPHAPGPRLRLAAALVRAGDKRGAVIQLDVVARMGGSAREEDLKQFPGRRFRSLRRRLAANAEPKVRSTVEFELEERDLLPESLAFDAADGSWYVGSLRKRKIVRRSADATVTDWIAGGRDGLGAVLGMKIDAERRELWAASCNDPGGSPAIDPPDEATLGRGALYRFGLPDGELRGVYAAGDRDAPVCFNDLALTADGTLYATGTGGIWRLLPGAGQIELWRADPGLLNGIAVSPDGARLYVADQLEGILLVDPASAEAALLRHPATESLAGVDGLYLAGATLVAIQNGFRSGPQSVLQAFLSGDGRRAQCVTLLERNHPSYSVPTTGAIVERDLVYVATSQLDRLGADGVPGAWEELRPNAMLRLALGDQCEPELRTRLEQLDPCETIESDDDDPADSARRRLYETSCAAALWFDGLFGEQQQIAAARNTSGRVELSALESEFEGLEFRTRLHVRMKFPNLENRLEAFFGRDESDDFLRDRNEGLALRSQFSQLIDEEDWIAGLGYSLPGTYRSKADFRVGGRGSTEPEVFTQGRYRHNREIGRVAVLRFRDTVFWTNRDGFGTTAAVDLDRAVGRTLLFRWGSIGTWSESTDGVDWRSATVLYQNLQKRRAILYEAFVRGESSAEVPLQEYGGRAIYRQPLFRSRWLFGELVLGYSWPREELDQPRDGSATVGVGLELLFGREP